MDFSKGQFEALINDITSGLDEFSTHIDKVGPVATAAANRWYVPPPAAEAIIWLANKTIEIGRELFELFVDLLKGTVAPIYMFYDAWRWMDVKGSATVVCGALSSQSLTVDNSEWSGRARDAYVDVAGAHSRAAERVGTIADSTSNHLLGCAVAGAAFYATLAAVLAKVIVAAVGVVAAFGSAVFSWAGAALLLEEAGVNTAVIGGALATLTAFLGAQAKAMVSLHGEAVDARGFPGEKWPAANAATYGDASVGDGDADWSLA